MSRLRFGAAAAAIALGAISLSTYAQQTENPAARESQAIQGGHGGEAHQAQPGQQSTRQAQGPSEAKAKPLLSGANSFTRRQARNRIAKAGFSNVRDLKKDRNGIWRGHAERNGQKVAVALDFRGHIVQQ